MAIAKAISDQVTASDLYASILAWSIEMKVSEPLLRCVQDAENRPPAEFVFQQGWVLIAFGNALYRLLHSPTLEDGIIDTVMCGGDSDTNAAIAGALLGSVHGRASVPGRWVDCLLRCRPAEANPAAKHPRPEVFWPVDALELATSLLQAGAELQQSSS
jgi:ADP-ribosyl-[dinitrogen reductase] hydrolase